MDRTGRVDHPQATFDDETAAALVAAASDITLLVTADGIIENASGDSQIWEAVPFQSWVGKKWADTNRTQTGGGDLVRGGVQSDVSAHPTPCPCMLTSC